jgi:hypothetical protein
MKEEIDTVNDHGRLELAAGDGAEFDSGSRT